MSSALTLSPAHPFVRAQPPSPPEKSSQVDDTHITRTLLVVQHLAVIPPISNYASLQTQTCGRSDAELVQIFIIHVLARGEKALWCVMAGRKLLLWAALNGSKVVRVPCTRFFIHTLGTPTIRPRASINCNFSWQQLLRAWWFNRRGRALFIWQRAFLSSLLSEFKGRTCSLSKWRFKLGCNLAFALVLSAHRPKLDTAPDFSPLFVEEAHSRVLFYAKRKRAMAHLYMDAHTLPLIHNASHAPNCAFGAHFRINSPKIRAISGFGVLLALFNWDINHTHAPAKPTLLFSE